MFLSFLLQSQNPVAALGGMIPILLIFGIFYFLLFMPMQKQKKQQAKMLAELANGQIVVTTGGIIGAIVGMSKEDDTLILRVKPDNIKLQVARSSISALRFLFMRLETILFGFFLHQRGD